ncbi:hypothetical protein L596_021434 [Steinernema carpocapsae]|uniref:Uncharacterized protein n=1 Tax=Steinernema carpocapsae TaxID=34508 RepID=A0A4U5MJ43_STECR|nr:hypothetical protein L596_021434 [Steinernema carpocapsae]
MKKQTFSSFKAHLGSQDCRDNCRPVFIEISDLLNGFRHLHNCNYNNLITRYNVRETVSIKSVWSDQRKQDRTLSVEYDGTLEMGKYIFLMVFGDSQRGRPFISICNTWGTEWCARSPFPKREPTL